MAIHKTGHPIHIRKTSLPDLESILVVLQGQVGESYFGDVAKEVEDSDIGAAECFVAENDEEVIGYVCWRRKVSVAYLETIAVKPQYQRKGIGGMLLNEAVSSIRANYPEIKILNVITDSDANDAISFYVKKGFVAAGIVNDEFIQGVSQIHLSLNLGKY